MYSRIYPVLLVVYLTGSAWGWQAPNPSSPKVSIQPAGPSPIPPTPQTIREACRLVPGMTMELVAHDPIIQSPVAAAFDEKGRLWVVEMPDYPNGPPKGGKPGGTIKILEDKDGDGVFDQASTFYEGLLFANGVLPWKNGAFVTCAPHILWLGDTDGDGKADKREVLFEGFTEGNPQLRVSFPILGPDGWVYVANGLRGGKIRRPNAPASETITLNGLDFRFHPVTMKGEALTGPGQFGNTMDAWGNRFVCDNRHHLRHVVLENRYVQRNPLLATGELVEDIAGEEAGPLSSGGKVWPISRNWTTSNLHAGRFTAACGVMAFQGTGLGPDYIGSVFTCDPTGNLVHEERLTEKGATFQSRSPQQGFEFLACSNEWFRPVSMIQGPDGSLFVIDMCRAVIEHPEFMPPELRTRADLLWGKEKGRIWRIRSESTGKPKVNPFLKSTTPESWVGLLGSEEGWVRAVAHRRLMETKDPGVLEKLKQAAASHPSAHSRFLAAFLVDAQGGMGDALWQKLLEDASPRVVEAGLIVGESRLREMPGAVNRLKALARHENAKVRYRVALCAGFLPPLVAADILTTVAMRDGEDKWTNLAIQSSAAGCLKELAQKLAKESKASTPVGLIQSLAIQIGTKGNVPDFQQLAQTALTQLSISQATLGPKTRESALAVIVGLTTGCRKKGQSLAELLKPWEKSDGELYGQWAALLAGQLDLLRNDRSEMAQRMRAVSLASMAGDKGQEALVNLARTAQDLGLRLAAIRELGQQGGAVGLGGVLDSWKLQPPAVRREIIETMMRAPDRIKVLLKRIEAGEIGPRDLDVARARQLLAHGDPEIQKLSQKLLAGSLPANRGVVIQDYLIATKSPGDPKRGAQIFTKNCATCHKVGGQGLDVGPDISDTRTKTEIMLLNDILNPNLAIDNNYVGYIVTLKNGRTITGMIRSSNASSLTLVRAENQGETVQQNEIDELVSTGQSFMPEGLEKNITREEMADLLAFLKNWRYLDGKTPLQGNPSK